MIKSTNPTPPGFVQRIVELISACGLGTDKRDVAIVTIKACIIEGVDTKGHIVGILHAAGINPGLVGVHLDGKRGARHSPYWRKNADGRYVLREEES